MAGFRPLARLVPLACMLAPLLVLPASAAPPVRTWARSYGGPRGDGAWTVAALADGGCIIGGWSESFAAGGDDMWVLRLAADGSIAWQYSYGGRSDDACDLVMPLNDGGYALAGYTASFGAGAIDAWLLRLRADGTVWWQKAYGGPGEDEAVSVQQTADGGYVLAGETQSFGAGGWDLWILKLDAAGAVQWQRTYGGVQEDTASADPIQQTPDGGYIVCGQTRSFGAGAADVWVLRLDAAGDVLWQETFGGAAEDEAHALRMTADGGCVVAGWTGSFGAGNLDIWVLKLDASGRVLWQKAIGGQRGDWTWTVYSTADGGCIVGGTTESYGAGSSDWMAVKLAADGAVQWQRTCGGQGADGAISVRPAADGGYFIVGGTQSTGAGGRDYWVVKLDAAGNLPGCTWVRACSARVADTMAAPSVSQAAVRASRATVMDTVVVATRTAATVGAQCVDAGLPYRAWLPAVPRNARPG